MKVFISWSGTRGRHVADALRDWLPYVIHEAQPWASSHDIGAGERWSPSIACQLEQTQFGIVCVTRDSLKAPWILFEAGALAKSLEEGRLCPYLIDLSPAELDGPLAQFQAVTATKEATLRLVRAIHSTMPNSQLSDHRLLTTFERFWPDLHASLQNLPPTDAQQVIRPDRVLLEEILEHVRSQARSPRARVERLGAPRSDDEFVLRIDIGAASPKRDLALVEFVVTAEVSFQAILDELFSTYLNHCVAASTFGKQWTLLDPAGQPLEKRGPRDVRSLAEVGIGASYCEFRVVLLGAASNFSSAGPGTLANSRLDLT